MALTFEQKTSVRDRIAEAFGQSLQKRSDYLNSGRPDNSYRVSIEQHLINYQKYIEGILDTATLDFSRTIAEVNAQCEFWEGELKKLP